MTLKKIHNSSSYGGGGGSVCESILEEFTNSSPSENGLSKKETAEPVSKRSDQKEEQEGEEDKDWGRLQWNYIAFYALIHLLGVYGLWATVSGVAKWQTAVAAYVEVILGTMGILAGAHRLWAHRSYKAKLPLRIFLAAINTLGFMYSILHWARDHRQHHKFTDTHADPHNAGRGFFYSHIGWLFWEKHRDCEAKHSVIDTADLMADPVVRLQFRFYKPLAMLIWGLLPTLIPMLCWGETFLNSVAVCVCFRYALTCHNVFLINSAAHLYGTKPYSKKMKPCENLFVSYMSLGEGYHNYHHYFPMDYSASELGWRHSFNPSSFFIEAMEWCGQAYDLKKPSPEAVRAASAKLGDGSYEAYVKATTNAFGVRQCAVAVGYFLVPIVVGLLIRWAVSGLLSLAVMAEV